MEELTEEINRYLSKEMSVEELENFENRLKTDAELKAEVELQRKTFRLMETAAWIETKNKVAQLNKKSAKVIPLRMISRVAAIAVIGLITTYVILHRSYSDANLFTEYYQSYPDRVTTMGDNDEAISEAMKLYNSEEYALAQSKFRRVNSGTSEPQSTYILYESVCLNKTGKHEDALKLLTSFQKYGSDKESVAWELILTNLAAGNSDETLKLLEAFIEGNQGYKRTEAKQLLEDLRSFWR